MLSTATTAAAAVAVAAAVAATAGAGVRGQVPIPPSAKTRCFARTDTAAEGTMRWTFSQWSQPPATKAFVGLPAFGQTTDFTSMVQFCDRVDIQMGDVVGELPEQWMGWNFGTMDSFVRGPQPKQGGQPDFVMTYSGGDTGAPCYAGRNATVKIYCSSGGKLNAHSCPPEFGTNATCPQGQSMSYCNCGTLYDRQNEPCHAKIGILLACPAPSKPHPVLPPSLTPPGGEPSPVGWIILVLLILPLLACGGGVVYNMKVKGKSGLEAVPFIHVLRRVAPGTGDSSHGYSRTVVDAPADASDASASHDTYGTL